MIKRLKQVICVAGVLSGSILSGDALASLSSDATLYFDDGGYQCVAYDANFNCTFSAVTTGSYFGISSNSTVQESDRVAMINAGTGLILDAVQSPGEIDEPWWFVGAYGSHATLNSLTIASVGVNTAQLDMTGWQIIWNGSDLDVDQGTDGTNYFASIVCDIDCSYGDRFSLDYSAISMSGATVGFTYQLHLEGVIQAPIPLPASLWLFLSGLMGIVGFRRTRLSNK